MKVYKNFIRGKSQLSSLGDLKDQVYLGSEQFADSVQRLNGLSDDLSEVPRIQSRAVVK